MRYRIKFSGRKIGAIGIFYPVALDIEADDPTDALLKAYETHEHIHNPRVYDAHGNHCPLPGQTPQPPLKDWNR